MRHLHRADPARLVELLSLDDADHLLTESAIRTPAIRMARDGTVLTESSYTRAATLAGTAVTGLVDGRKALRLFDDGATVVFQGLHRYWPPLAELVAELELELGHPCQANAYLTPPGAQGFAVHSDSHDVFVFQTHGSKQWEVHTDDGVEDVLLEPGLSMYLPTGTPHAARAQETVSLHVTLGINQLTWRGLVERAVATARWTASTTPTCRRDTSTTRPTWLAACADRLSGLADALRGVDPRRGRCRRGGAVPHQSAVPVARWAQGRPGGAQADRHHPVAAARRPPVRPHRSGRPPRVLLGDRELDVPGWLRPALEQVRAA